jgi:hypothetical protein
MKAILSDGDVARSLPEIDERVVDRKTLDRLTAAARIRRELQRRDSAAGEGAVMMLHGRKRGDIVDEMRAKMTSNGFAVGKLPSSCGVVANTNGCNDTADAMPVRSSCSISKMTL